MHLVSWEKLKRSISEGGLRIWDPKLVNLAMGGKIIWQLYADKNHSISKIFRKKYLKGKYLRNMKPSSIP